MNNKYAKAVLATLIAFGGAIVTVLGTSPQQNLSHLGTYDYLKIIVAFLATGGLTWWVKNIPGIAGGVIKMVAAGGGAFVTALIAAYADSIVTQGELIGAIVAGFVAVLAVYQQANLGQEMSNTTSNVAQYTGKMGGSS